jgi:ABC-type multidrug transport system fused ATPase/permease subunit
VLAGRLTPGELIVFFVYVQGFYRPLRRISRVVQRASKASTCVARVTSVLDRPSDLPDGDREAPPLRGDIRFERVSFAYPGGPEVLHDVDLAVPVGRTVAFVGPTGAGKTTLLALVPRLHDPTAGIVRVDGHDVRELTLRSLRDQVSVVPQDGMLFSGTIYENIAYGDLEATPEQVEEAARAARIHDVVAALPEGYGTVVGERGVTLSGGERQRLAIARALVRDAPIVLLDEPTTHLDSTAQQLVVEALERLLEGRTVLVVAHRLETVRRADEVVALEAGRIVRRGRFGKLFASSEAAAG